MIKQEHKQTFVRARVSVDEKRIRSLSDPSSSIMIQIDDMDNHKVKGCQLALNYYFFLYLSVN